MGQIFAFFVLLLLWLWLTWIRQNLPVGLNGSDEELCTIGIWSRIDHGNHTCKNLIVLEENTLEEKPNNYVIKNLVESAWF